MPIEHLHRISIHVPIALACLLPLLYVAFHYMNRVYGISDKIWLLFWVFSIVMVGSNGFAFVSGMRAVHLSAAPLDALEQHRQMATWFLTSSLVVFALSARRAFGLKSKLVEGLLIVSLLCQLALGAYAGHLGGVLIP